MRSLSWLGMLLNRRARFRLTESIPLPTAVTLRLFQVGDRDACLGMYRDNEAGKFPPGFGGYFEDFLDRPDYLKVVLCEKDIPVAVGGIGVTPHGASQSAWLAFGLVTPGFHNRDLGTALLLSRISLLPEPSPSVRLLMTNVARSGEFFARFGFASFGKVPSGRPDIQLPCNSTLLDAATWRLCRERVNDLGLKLQDAAVPQIDLFRPSPNQEHQTGIMLARNWRISWKLNQAVLLQLAGLICLFVIRSPYNSLTGGYRSLSAAFCIDAS